MSTSSCGSPSARAADPARSAERPPLDVAVVGLGRAGVELARAVTAVPHLRLAAGVVSTPAKVGVDVGRLTGTAENGVLATSDLDAVLRDPAIGCVLHAGLGDPSDVAAVLGRCADHGKDAITVSGLVHPRTALGPDGFERLRARAIAGGARLVGTGVNPGFVLDVLPVVWGSMVTQVRHVRAVRVSEIGAWGDGILAELGVGRPVAEVVDVSPLSVAESLAVIVDGLGLEIDAIDEQVRPIAAERRREHGGRAVEVGRCAGFRRIATATAGGTVVAEIEWIALLGMTPDDEHQETASLRIEGESVVEAEARGTFFGDPYPSTAARAVRSIGPLAAMPPGLYRPDQLAVSVR